MSLVHAESQLFGDIPSSESSFKQQDLEVRRMNAEARLLNAKARQMGTGIKSLPNVNSQPPTNNLAYLGADEINSIDDKRKRGTPKTASSELQRLVQAYKKADSSEQDSRFLKGQLLAAMIAEGATQKFLSTAIGVSPAQVRELVHVYRTFPDTASRVPELSWYHHRVASRSDNPAHYISMAAKEMLSVRQLREKILHDSERATGISAERKVTAEERWFTRWYFDRLLKVVVKRGLPTPTDWNDKLVVFVWWEKLIWTLDEPTVCELNSAFKVDDKDGKLALEMRRVIDERFLQIASRQVFA